MPKVSPCAYPDPLNVARAACSIKCVRYTLLMCLRLGVVKQVFRRHTTAAIASAKASGIDKKGECEARSVATFSQG